MTSDWIVEALLRFLEENFRDHSKDLQAFVRETPLSARYVGRVFKQAFSLRPREVLIKLRMETAAEMLGDPMKQVKDIALDLGYNDTANFCTDFKRYHGCTPTQYRTFQPRRVFALSAGYGYS